MCHMTDISNSKYNIHFIFKLTCDKKELHFRHNFTCYVTKFTFTKDEKTQSAAVKTYLSWTTWTNLLKSQRLLKYSIAHLFQNERDFRKDSWTKKLPDQATITWHGDRKAQVPHFFIVHRNIPNLPSNTINLRPVFKEIYFKRIFMLKLKTR